MNRHMSTTLKNQFVLCVLFVGVLFVLHCGDTESADRPAVGDSVTENQNKQGSKLYTLRINDITLNVEIAQDPESLQEGLMFRESLPENQGMLFVFPYERILSFWMRNTYIPLDIAFINSAGQIIDIQTMEPIDESKHYISSAPALYALEVNGGWFERHQIGVGATVNF